MSRKSHLVTKLTDWFTQLVQRSAASLGLNSQGESQVSSEVNFIHLRYPTYKRHLDGTFTAGVSPCGGMTVAYKYLLDDAFNRTHLVVAYAKCAKGDHFNKRMGRIKAAARLDSQKFKAVVPAEDYGNVRSAEQAHALQVVASIIEGAAVGDFLDMRTKNEAKVYPKERGATKQIDTTTGQAFSLSDDELLGFGLDESAQYH